MNRFFKYIFGLAGATIFVLMPIAGNALEPLAYYITYQGTVGLIDLATGSWMQCGSITGDSGTPGGLVSVGNHYYTVTEQYRDAGATLYKVASNGKLTMEGADQSLPPIVSIGGFRDNIFAGFDGGGEFYAIHEDGTADDLGPTGIGAIDAVSVGATSLYFQHYPYFYRIDTKGGKVHKISSNQDYQLGAIVEVNNELYGTFGATGAAGIVTINPLTGRESLVVSNSTIQGGIVGLAPSSDLDTCTPL